MTDDRAYTFIVATKLVAIKLKLQSFGVPHNDAHRLVAEAFEIGWKGCADDFTRQLEEAA